MLLEPFSTTYTRIIVATAIMAASRPTLQKTMSIFHSLPAAHLKVVVDRAHLKDTLPGELEGGHLEHYTGRFTNVDDPDDQQ